DSCELSVVRSTSLVRDPMLFVPHCPAVDEDSVKPPPVPAYEPCAPNDCDPPWSTSSTSWDFSEPADLPTLSDSSERDECSFVSVAISYRLRVFGWKSRKNG